MPKRPSFATAGPRGWAGHAAVAVVLAPIVASLAAGCGANFKLPTERREGRVIAGAGTYQMIGTRAGLNGIQDILLTPSGELFLLFRGSGGNPGRVDEYPLALGGPLSTQFPGLLNPAALCFGANKVFVLDQGDTNSARATVIGGAYTADCGPIPGFSRPIVDVSKYWQVHAYRLNGAPTGTFTDTTFLWVNGIAADEVGRVYVGGIIYYCFVDPFDTRIKTLTSRYRIYRYVQGPPSGSVIGDNWQRDASWEIGEGTGIGSTRDPRGMHWASPDGAALYFCDYLNNEVQKFADPGSSASSYKIDFGGSGTDSIPLLGPLDVTVDSAGYVYVADTGNQRVLRYDPEARFVQRVDIEADAFGQSVDQAVAVAADNEQVYVADAARSEVVRYRRRK